MSGDVHVRFWESVGVQFPRATHLVLGLQSKTEAERCLAELKKRLAKFGVALNFEKTRLWEFGCCAIANRKRRHQGRPETFDFLGFTHLCGTKRSNGRYTVIRQTVRSRMSRKLQEIKAELRKRMHEPVPKQGDWLASVVGGFVRYHGVPTNWSAVRHFRHPIGRYWHFTLRRRSERKRINWDRMRRLIKRWLPPAEICHPYPLKRMGVIT